MMLKVILLTLLALIMLAPASQAFAGGMEMKADLSPGQKAIIPIAAFTANGETGKLRSALEAGLSAGLSINEIKEILVQLYAYAGFPRSLTAINEFRKLLEKRREKGISDTTGPEPREVPKYVDRNAIGARIQTALVGRPVSGPIYEFAPVMDKFLKEHLFCDIFYRNILSDKDRELATISALAALPAPVQLASHLKVCLNVGWTMGQLAEAAAILGNSVSEKDGQLVNRLLDEMSPAGATKGK